MSVVTESARCDAALPPLTLASSRPAPGVLVVAVGGELDLWTAPVLEQYLREETAYGPAELVVDLSELTFIGSHGCRLLLASADDDHGIAGRVSLVGTDHRPIARVLEVTGLAEVLPIYDDVDELLADLWR